MTRSLSSADETVNQFSRFQRTFSRAATLIDLLVIAAVAVVAMRLLLAPVLPRTDDLEFHLYRLVDYYDLLRHGEWYPRWSPTMAAGYGYPVYNFYPPFSMWIGALPQLIGFGAVAALKIAFAGSILVAGFGMYAFARHDQGRAGALVAGVAYACLPYFLADVYVRGALAEAWGIAMLPLVFSTWRNAADHRTIRAIVLAGGAFAVLLLSHHLTALLAAPVGTLYLLVYQASFRGVEPRARGSFITAMCRSLFPVGATFASGLAFGAVFWLPALLELRFASPHLLTTGSLDLRYNFHPPADLVQRSVLYQYVLPPGHRAGLVQVAMAVAGVVAASSVGSLRRGAWFFGGVLALSLGLQSTLAAPAWEWLPMVRFVQFPWRLLALTGLASAYLAGALGAAIHAAVSRPVRDARSGAHVALDDDAQPLDGEEVARTATGTAMIPTSYPPGGSQLRRFLAEGLVVVAAAAVALPSLIPIERPTIPLYDDHVSPTSMQQFELSWLGIGATTLGEYLPSTTTVKPTAFVHLPENPDPSPRPAQISVKQASHTSLRFATRATERGPVIIDQLYFPGWNATIDGAPAEVTPFGSLGLASVMVPAGEHEVEFYRAMTPLESIASLVTLLSVAAIAVVAIGRGTRDPRRHWRLLLVGIVALGGLALTLVPVRVAAVSGPSAEFANGARFAGWRVKAVPGLEATGILTLELYWTALQRPRSDFTVALRLLDARGNVVGARDQIPSHGLRPPRLWIPGLVVRDEQQIRLAEGVPAGRYRLGMSIRHADTWGAIVEGPRVSWREADGAEVTGVLLGEVDLTAALPRSAPDLAHRAGVVFADAIELVSWEVEAPPGEGGRLADVQPGDSILVRLKWRARSDLPNYWTFIHLHDSAGNMLTQDDDRPHRGYAPTLLWLRGDELLDEYELHIPPDAGPGRYVLSVGWYRRPEVQNLTITSGPIAGDRYVLGVVKVNSAQVMPESAPGFRPVGVTFGERARLRGVVVASPEPFESGRVMWVTLYWEAIGGPWPDATVFVHLVDGAGKLVAQHDGPPMQGGFPLSIWSDGDVIADPHPIVLPPEVSLDEARLAIGLYDPQTGARYTREDGGDAVTLPLGER